MIEKGLKIEPDKYLSGSMFKKLNTESGNLKKTFVVVPGLLAQTAINTSL